MEQFAGSLKKVQGEICGGPQVYGLPSEQEMDRKAASGEGMLGIEIERPKAVLTLGTAVSESNFHIRQVINTHVNALCYYSRNYFVKTVIKDHIGPTVCSF